MTRAAVAGISCAAALMLGACGPRPQVTPAPPRADLVVLLPDPEDGRVGAATVSATGGSVELTSANDSTRVVPGQAPGAPQTITSEEVQRLFGDALAARPLPPRHFLLYFETGSDTLTPESQALVTEIVAFVGARPAPDVTVIGHTDTTGDPKSNIDLGLRRATLIRDLLISSGLGAAQVEVASHGEADLLVPTPDGTDEARNRRVEVTVR
ncbi:MAG TPA: OmpA family protein [Vicinamibacterales bacterium]|nr:OmpA family protein [Vicinamibacterales bacterium]